jgi:hypothetical protein
MPTTSPTRRIQHSAPPDSKRSSRANRRSRRPRDDPRNNPRRRQPFSYPELRARVEGLLRRAELLRRPGRLRVGDPEIDSAARVVFLRGAPIPLSQQVFALAHALAADPTRVFTKDELLRTIWGFRTLGSNRRKAP